MRLIQVQTLAAICLTTAITVGCSSNEAKQMATPDEIQELLKQHPELDVDDDEQAMRDAARAE